MLRLCVFKIVVNDVVVIFLFNEEIILLVMKINFVFMWILEY